MVEVSFLTDEPYILGALGAKISQSPLSKSIDELYRECKDDEKASKKLVQDIIKKYNHMILADFSSQAIVIDGLTRFAALYLWRNVNVENQVYAAGIETSLRVVKIDKNTRHHPIANCLWDKSIDIYREAIEQNIPQQDARYVLPEAIYTRIILSSPPRYLFKIGNSLEEAPLQELQTIGRKINEIIEKETGMISEEKVLSRWDFFGGSGEDIKEKVDIHVSKYSSEKVDPYSISMIMYLKGSLALFAQLVRQRLNLCVIEPLENIAYKGKFVVPPSFGDEIMKKYREFAKEANELQMRMIENSHVKDPSFVYLLLLGQQADARLYGSGYGLIDLSKERSEGVAQWEIRSKVGIPVTKELAKFQEIRNKIGPRCYREGRCIEPLTFKTKMAICPSFKVAGGKWDRSLEELLDLLDESSKFSVFTVRS
ncbi:MAG: FAD-dependent thymidylate synthase [Candidatus Aenigmatarchaeota archaeon]